MSLATRKFERCNNTVEQTSPGLTFLTYNFLAQKYIDAG